MNDIQTIENSIEKGLAYLENHQYPNGEFCCYLAQDLYMQKNCLPDSSIFATTLIVNSLLPLKQKLVVRKIIEKAGWLIKCHQLRGGVWNYYTAWNIFFKIFPPDVDDTVFASQVLKTLNIPYPDNIPQLLSNRNKEGLFYTWFMPYLFPKGNKIHWQIGLRAIKYFRKYLYFLMSFKKINTPPKSIDAVVNANVLYYMGYNKDTAPIIPLLINTVNNDQEDNCDHWYRNPFTFYYFVSRNYSHCPLQLEPIRQTMINRILNKTNKNGGFGEAPLDTALGINSLLNLNYTGEGLTGAIQYLVSQQYKTGEWQRKGLYCSGSGMQVVLGSEELNTGFCIEALARYKEIITNQKAIGKELNEVS